MSHSNVSGTCQSSGMETTPQVIAAAFRAGDALGADDGDLSSRLSGIPDGDLLSALDAAFARRRVIDADIVSLAGEITNRSRPTLGAEGLASRVGETSAAAVIASVGRVGIADARRFCRLADATTARMSLTGEMLPALLPALAAALQSGAVGVEAATHIATALNQAAPRADLEELVVAETALVDFAGSNPADQVRALAFRYRDALDVDGVEPREAELVAGRSLRRILLPNGLKRFHLDLDPLSAAHLDASIDAAIGETLRQVRFDTVTGSMSEEVPDVRTLTQIGADAVVDLARHGNACTNAHVPTPSVTVVVRMTLESLLAGLGAATIDGSGQPITAGTARLLAADANIIPLVLGGNSETLDLGRTRRLFSRPQRIALADRDGGCAFPHCDRPPTWTEAHHILWWSQGGSTNLDNGVLLCTRHHHTVHDHGWDIDVHDGVPWFHPPPTIDPARTPRRGGTPPRIDRRSRQARSAGALDQRVRPE